jgi:hypothetical protein
MSTKLFSRHGVSSAKGLASKKHAAARGVFVALLLSLAPGHTLAASGAQVTGLRCEYLVNPLGLDVLQPRLNWRLASERRGEQQTAYRVIVASSPKRLDQEQGDLWDSGKVESDRSIQVEYAGKPLGSEQRCYWKVRVWDKDGGLSPWSPAAFWAMGGRELPSQQAISSGAAHRSYTQDRSVAGTCRKTRGPQKKGCSASELLHN